MTTVAQQLSDVRDRLQAYRKAELKILQAQDYSVGQGSTARKLTRADLGEVRATIDRLQNEEQRLAAQLSPRGARRVIYLRPF